MAKLPRTTQKIFAKNAPANQITTFGSIKAGTPVYSTSASDIMNANFEGGWSDAVEDDYAPYRQDRNAVDTAVTQQLAYLYQEGIPEWDSGTVYYKGSIVKYNDGNNSKIYKAIYDNTTAALTNTSRWQLVYTINNSGEMGDVKLSGTPTAPTATSGTSTTQIATTEFVSTALSGKANDSDVVKLTGNQTVAGVKTFSNEIHTTSVMVYKKTGVTKGTNPESTQYWRFFFTDKNGGGDANTLGKVQTSLSSNGLATTSLVVYKNATGTSSANISINYPTSGSAYTSCPTPTEDTTSSVQIDTVGARNTKLLDYALDNAVVKLTGAQSVSGVKTFTASNINHTATTPSFRQNNSDITKGTAPNSAVNNYSFVYRDSANKNMGSLLFTYDTSKNTTSRLYSYKANSSSDSGGAYANVYYNANGTYGLKFEGSISADTNESLTKSTTSTTELTIPCMGWINSRLQNILTRYVNGDSGYIIYDFGGDKYIEQWGHHTYSSTGFETVTLSQAYADNMYSVVGVQSGDASTLNDVKVGYYDNTTTTFKTKVSTSGTGLNWRTFGKAA